MEKRWQKSEIAHLKRHAKTRSIEELAQRLHTDPETVQRKLEELGLMEGKRRLGAEDPSLEHFEEALTLLHDKKWSQAAKLFEKVTQESDGFQLRDRARQSLEICNRQMSKPEVPEDDYLRAVVAKNQGQYQAALELCEDQAEKDERFAYLAASIYAIEGADDKALGHLENAIRLEPKNRVHAFHDPDFESLRDEEAFHDLLAAS